MKRANEEFKPCFIDYIWYVAETWSAKEHTNLNGGMLSKRYKRPGATL